LRNHRAIVQKPQESAGWTLQKRVDRYDLPVKIEPAVDLASVTPSILTPRGWFGRKAEPSPL
jgi:hypothetical protein